MKTTNSLFKALFIASAFAMVLIFITCKKEKTSEPVNGTITGKVVAKNNHTPIGSAQIIAGGYSTRSDKNGNFTLEVKPGAYHLIIQTGKGHLFKTEMDITVGDGEQLALPATSTVLKQDGNMAYIAGAYDKIETIINDSLGYSAFPITVNDLDNDSLLGTFEAIFLNCGALNMFTLDSLKYTNLGNFYQNGGSIYASDFAVEFLTGDGNWRLYGTPFNNQSKGSGDHAGQFSILSTCTTPKIGGFMTDSSLCCSKSGPAGLVTNIDVLAADLVTALGKDSIDIEYDLGGWEVVSVVDAPFETILQNNNPGAASVPVAVRTVSSTSGSGMIYFTTFHNNPQSTISPDVQNVLQFFILNL
ncbi:MAG: carboxypeptidase-like regulatory domain-containing protein [Bacteroidia bacterium]